MRITAIAAAVLFLLPLAALAQSTSPNPQLVEQMPLVAADGDSQVITFSEYPVGTPISDQYRSIGVIFGGSGPFISPDGANPTSPVLSGTPRFQGDITGRFVEPGTDNPTIVESFTFDAGYFDEIGSTRIEWFDPSGKKLGQRINSHYGIERFTIDGGNIASWRMMIVQNEPAGYAIDNLSFRPVGSSVLFRDNGSTIIPGWDHSAFQIGDKVYESHPAYPAGVYVSADGEESIQIAEIYGVQKQHSRGTFRHDSKSVTSTPVIGFEEIPIGSELAGSMRDAAETVMGHPFQRLQFKKANGDFDWDGIEQTLSPASQKGGGGAFTCVGLVEWSAEQAGHNGGQGFIPSCFESVTIPDPRTFPPGSYEFPLISPQVLNWAMKGSLTIEKARQWVQGFFDPVDFLVIDPLGRRLGYVEGLGLLNEIPNSFFSGDGDIEQFLIPYAVPGEYLIQMVGKGANVAGGAGTLGGSMGFAGMLAQGEVRDRHIYVEPKPGCAGDVDGDGDVDRDDITALSQMLNRFTDGLGHPGDLDGDGLLSNADVTLLTRLVELLEASRLLPVITQHPQDRTVGMGETCQFMVTATNATDYRWRKDGVDMPGATDPCLSIGSVAAGDVGRYDCAVSNGNGSVISDIALLSVQQNGSPGLFQAFPGTSFGAATQQTGYQGQIGDAVTSVPGVFSIVPGEKWANFVKAAQLDVEYTLKNVVLKKTTPEIIQCADVFPVKTVSQQGTPNIRLWWPLMYETAGTTWTLSILYGTSTPWDDDGAGPNPAGYVHTEEWKWELETDIPHMKLVLDLFHELPFGLDEVPLISDEALFSVLKGKLDGIQAFIDDQKLTDAGLLLGDFEMEVMDACILVSPAKPKPTGPGTGIANTIENPACCKLMADAEYVGIDLGIFQPAR